MNRTLFTRLLGIAAVACALMLALTSNAGAQIARSDPGQSIQINPMQPVGGDVSTGGVFIDGVFIDGGAIGAAQSVVCGYNYGGHTGWADLYNHCGGGRVWVAIEINWGWSDWAWTCVDPSRGGIYTNLNNRVPGKNVTYAKSYGQAC